MTSWAVAVIFLVVLLGVNSQVQYKCTRTPTKWMGDSFLIDYDTKVTRFSETYYDGSEETIYERVYRRDDRTSTQYEEWYNFRTGVKVNRTFGEECRSYSFTYTFKPFGVPTDARFEERGTFGVYLPEDEFSGEWGEDSQDEGGYYLHWIPINVNPDDRSDITCVPAIESYIRERTTTPYQFRRNIHVLYMNITTNFENPPQPCTPNNAQKRPHFIL